MIKDSDTSTRIYIPFQLSIVVLTLIFDPFAALPTFSVFFYFPRSRRTQNLAMCFWKNTVIVLECGLERGAPNAQVLVKCPQQVSYETALNMWNACPSGPRPTSHCPGLRQPVVDYVHHKGWCGAPRGVCSSHGRPQWVIQHFCFTT